MCGTEAPAPAKAEIRARARRRADFDMGVWTPFWFFLEEEREDLGGMLKEKNWLCE